jgi:hypothetical protein
MRVPTLLFFPLFTVAALAGCGSSQATPKCPPVAGAEASDASAGAPAGEGDLAALSDEQLARKILELTGAADLGKQVIDGMSENLRKLPGLPPGFTDRLKQNARAEDLTELVVPIYVKNYDRETMIAAIRFYQSKHGQTLVAKLPQVTQESMDAGRIWGRALAEKTLKEMGLRPPKGE